MANDYAKALGVRCARSGHSRGCPCTGSSRSPRTVEGRRRGSYERGDRAVTVQKLSELAQFYGVPVAELLPDGSPNAAAEPPPSIVIDLEALQQVSDEQAGPLTRYVAAIQSQRGDYNGKVLSIRQDDLRTLAVIYDESPSVLTEQLITWGVLNPDARRAAEQQEQLR